MWVTRIDIIDLLSFISFTLCLGVKTKIVLTQTNEKSVEIEEKKKTEAS